MYIAESVVRLPVEDSGPTKAIVRFNNGMIDAKRKDKTRFFRREPLLIRNPENGCSIIRYGMGNGGTVSIKRNEIALDYDAIDSLCIQFKIPVQLEIRRATAIEIYKHYWFHPELSVQLSVRLGVIGCVLGVLGFITAIIPLVGG